MKILNLTGFAFLLSFGALLLGGCAPMPYQGCYHDSYTEVIIIHDPGPPPCPLPPEPVRNVPLTRKEARGDDQPRVKQPRREVTSPSRASGAANPVLATKQSPRKNRNADPVQVAERSPRRSPRTR